MTTPIPTPQHGNKKSVSFRMTGGGKQKTFVLPIVSELQRSHPGRLTTTQTLGGAFQDVNDMGISQITVSGNTGWRFRNGMDGFQAAQLLYHDVFEEYYRRARVDPKKIELLLINGVDGYVWKVSFDDMQMFRSVSQPLLYSYTCQFTVLMNMNDPPDPAPDAIQDLVNDTDGQSNSASDSGTSHNNKPPRTYKVQTGDTLSGIAYKFYKDWRKYKLIAQVNHIKNPNYIQVGWILKIPWV